MKLLKLAVSLACLCGLLVFSSPPAAAAVSANIPLDSWVYPALDKLTGLGLIDSSLQGARPYTRLEAVRQLTEARRRAADEAVPPVAGELLRRLESEFADELAEAAAPAPTATRFILTSGEAYADPLSGRRLLPQRLTNTDRKAGQFELQVFVAPAAGDGAAPLLYADGDGEGRPDDGRPLHGPVSLGAGESFAFVVVLPPAEPAAAPATVTVTATSVVKPRQTAWLKPLRELRLDYQYQHGQPSPFPGTDGRQFALNTNNFGIDFANRHNGQVVFESEARLGRYALLNVRPLLQVRETAGDSLRLLHGTVAVGLGPLELSAGRQSLWWGQGRHGSLVLTDNARPLDMLRLTNPQPATLPWIFRYLGPVRFDLFLSSLERDRVVPEPYFGGLRLNIKPASWLELGASRTVLFGGKGRPDVGFDDFLTIVGGNNLSGEEDTSNQLAAVDFRLRLAPLWGAELYGEMGGEDEADLLGFIPFVAKKAVLAGLYLPRIEPSGRLSLRLEYADTDYEGNGPVWYRHGIYRSGYVYQERLLGHHAGGDASDLFVELKAFLPRDITLSASFDAERRGVSGPLQEKHNMPSLDVEWAASPALRLHAGYSFDRVRNFAFVAGDDRDFHLGRAGVSWRW